MSILRSSLVSLGFLVVASTAPGAVVVPVDFSIAGRPDSIAPGYAQWLITGGTSDTKTFGGVTFTVSKAGGPGSGLTSTWNKGLAVDSARMAVDGITVAGGERGGEIELRLSGLPAGKHSLVTYHNSSQAAEAREVALMTVSVDGQTVVSGLRPSYRVTSDYDAAFAYLEFEARAGRDVVVRFKADPAGTDAADRSVILSGFVLNAPDPARRAVKPYPFDGDGHVDADDGAFTLDWVPAKNAFVHRVYFGTDRSAVAAATPASREYRGAQVLTGHRVYGLGAHDDYFWRIDEVDSQGRVTPGEVWSFRARRLAFPGAQGYGRFARGGRGGRVIEVTSLNDSGPGSLRAAVDAEGPRTVVFTVSGLITLESRLVIRNNDLTIAGQTAPGKGITVRKYNVGMSGGDDVVVRHLRVRPGNIAGITLDGMGMQGSNHSIIDHCSISWTLDEAFSSRSARNITLQNTLISEALNVAGHKNYPVGSQHGYAASISGLPGSFHHNLLAHNSGRNWSLAGGLDQAGRHTGYLDIRNNVVYNWQNRTTDGGAAQVQFVNNYYKPGPATKVFHLVKPERNNIGGFGPQNYFIEGNIMEGHTGADDPLGGVVVPDPRRVRRSGDDVQDRDDARPSGQEELSEFVMAQPFFDSHVETQSAAAAYKIVLSNVGANQPMLDDHDARVIRETLAGTTTYRGSRTGLPGIPDNEADVGGWETYPEERRAPDWDSDHDGLPDWWERLHGLNPHSAAGDFSDSNAVDEPFGYTQLERYLNWMARPHVATARGAAVKVDLGAYTRGFTDRPVHTIDGARHGRAEVLAGGSTARFTPAPGFAGLAEFTFTVRDAAGDAMTRAIGVLVQ